MFSLKSGKEKMTKRDAKTGFSIRAEEIRTGEVVWVGEICHTMSDTVLISELESLESDKCIQKPIHPSCGGVRKWLEPVLMVFTTGIVAYLFYTVRSN